MSLSPKKSVPVTNIEVIFPADINHHGTLFGGRLMAWMDKAAYYASFRYSSLPCVTASVESLDFAIAPQVGDLLDFEASVIHTGKSSMVVKVDVFRTDVHRDNERRLANSGYFTFVAVNPEGRPQQIHPLLVETEEEKLRWKKGEEIKQQALARRTK